jgi:hypothetical protein
LALRVFPFLWFQYIPRKVFPNNYPNGVSFHVVSWPTAYATAKVS